MVHGDIPAFGSQTKVVAELSLYQPQDSQQNGGFTRKATKSQDVESVAFIWLILVMHVLDFMIRVSQVVVWTGHSAAGAAGVVLPFLFVSRNNYPHTYEDRNKNDLQTRSWIHATAQS